MKNQLSATGIDNLSRGWQLLILAVFTSPESCFSLITRQSTSTLAFRVANHTFINTITYILVSPSSNATNLTYVLEQTTILLLLQSPTYQLENPLPYHIEPLHLPTRLTWHYHYDLESDLSTSAPPLHQ